MTTFLDVAQSFQLAYKAMAMYTASHPRTGAAMEQLAQMLGQWLSEKPSLQMVSSNQRLFIDGQPVEGQNVHVLALARQLGERQISGLIFQRGVTSDELNSLLNLLMLKPSRLEEMGGAAKKMDELRLPHISLTQTQYREVKEGDGGADETPNATPITITQPADPKDGEGDGAGTGSGEASAFMDLLLPAATATLLDVGGLMNQWRDQIAGMMRDPGLDAALGGDAAAAWRPHFPGALPPADLSALGSFVQAMGWGTALPRGTQMEGFRQGLLGLRGEQQLAVLAGFESLAHSPASLRLAFQAMAPELFGTAATRLLEQGIPWSSLKEALYDILRNSTQKQTLVEVLGALLQNQGIGLERVEALIRQLDWDGQSTENKLRRALEGELWELTLDQRLAFLRDLLDQGQTEALLRVLDQILERLTDEVPRIREGAAQTLAGVTRWMQEPGLPMEAEGPLMDGLKSHFGWEPLQPIHRATTEALEHIVVALVSVGEVFQARDLYQELEGLLAFLEGNQDWRMQALNRLKARFLDPTAVHGALEQLHLAEGEHMLSEALPFFEFLGQEGAAVLVQALADEPDRRRRGRLLEVIRALGQEALPALHQNLSSPTWYVVRNTLNLLSELGHAGFLKDIQAVLRFPDPRVRQAAVRALWKLGGPAAEQPLLEFLPEPDPETRIEIMFALGKIQSARAIAPLVELMGQAQQPEKLRLKALEVLGQIGRAEAVPALAEVLRRKGRIFTTAEPLPFRLAAARALRTIGTPSALDALKKLVEAEPKGSDRDQLHAILTAHH